jgi:hypothetical protein
MAAHVAFSLWILLVVFSIILFRLLVNPFWLGAMLSHPLNKVQMKIGGGIEDGSPMTDVGDDGAGFMLGKME